MVHLDGFGFGYRHNLENIRISVTCFNSILFRANLSSSHIINPTAQIRSSLEKLASFQEVNIILDTFLQVGKWKKVDVIDGLCNCSLAWFLVFNFATNIVVGKGKHSAISVVKDCNLSRAEETLRDHNAPKRFFSEKK